MRRFVVQLSVFMVPVLVVGSAMEYVLRRIPNDYSYKSEYLDAHAQAINTLILGSSHSFAGLDPVYFSRPAFNAANGTQTLDFDYQILKKYGKKFDSLHTVVIPISYFTFFYDLAHSIESWRIMDYVLYFHLPVARSYKDYFELLSNNMSFNVYRVLHYYLKGDRTGRGLTCTPLGRRKDFGPPQNLEESGRARARFHTVDTLYSAANVALYDANRAALDSIVQWSKKKKVRVVLFTPPAYESYRRNLDPEQLRLTIATARDIAGRNGNCVYVNLLADTTFVARDFHDADHPSDSGARKLSILINSIVAAGT